MKLTLLSVVQSYLNRVSDFYVSSIFETEASQQVATIAEEVYFSLAQKFRDWEFNTVASTLDSVTDPDRPNYLKIPDGLQHMSDLSLSYNNTTEDRAVNYIKVTYLPPKDFIAAMERRSDTADNTQVVEDFGGTKFVIQDNVYPKYWTSFDGVYAVFDAYNSEEENTLHESKSRALYSQEQRFLQQDDFIIPIPEHLSELYRDLVIVECYEHLLQQAAPPSIARRVASRMATAQQQERKTGSMNRSKRSYGR